MANEAEQQRLYRVRHSLAHVMAQAVVERYPQAKMGIGPPIDTGFYYDFDLGPDGRPAAFLHEDEQIERRMRQIIGQRYPFEYRELSEGRAHAVRRPALQAGADRRDPGRRRRRRRSRQEAPSRS